MTAINFRQPNTRPARRAEATHLFAMGQAVRLKAGLMTSVSKSSEIYHITAALPPKGTSFQYRIRNDDERHERVTTEDNLEPVDMTRSDNGANLIERTFGHGQRTETQ